MVAEQCLCIDSENVLATAEQMQEALQQLQVQGARIAALEAQLYIESARAQTAEQERSALIQTLGAMRTDRGGTMVDTNVIGQPFMLKGTADQDFGEWTHKVRTFMLARFGDQTLTALTWAARQRKIVVKTCVASQRDRFVPWVTVFGEQGDEDEQIDNIDDFVGKFYAQFVSFTTDRTQQDRSELWRRQWLGSMETTAQRVRPDVVHETCGDPAASSEPSSMPTGPRLGICSGRLALEETSIRYVHRQERTALPGIRRQPCGGHVPADAKKPGGNCHVC